MNVETSGKVWKSLRTFELVVCSSVKAWGRPQTLVGSTSGFRSGTWSTVREQWHGGNLGDSSKDWDWGWVPGSPGPALGVQGIVWLFMPGGFLLPQGPLMPTDQKSLYQSEETIIEGTFKIRGQDQFLVVVVHTFHPRPSMNSFTHCNWFRELSDLPTYSRMQWRFREQLLNLRSASLCLSVSLSLSFAFQKE